MKLEHFASCAAIGAMVSAAACSVYDESLVGTGGGATTGTGQGGGATTSTTATTTSGTTTSGTTTSGTTTTTGSTTSTGGGGCAVPDDCPGIDDECQTRTCQNDTCGFDFTAVGTALAQQIPGDCLEQQCDGQGGVTAANDDADLPDDGKECTTDTCAGGQAVLTPKAVHTACSEGGGKFCNASAACVECTEGTDCPDLVCDATFSCAPADCGDTVKNGTETDVDCGGASCSPCATGDDCIVNTDCIGGSCSGGTCQPTCTDTLKNNAETDVDCGGPTCSPCDVGQTCSVAGDCASGKCTAGLCAYRLVISEIRSRGLGGGNDEFIEIYNPTTLPVVLDNTWQIEARSSSAGSYTPRWTGSGGAIAAHGHYLVARTGVAGGYSQMPAPDASMSSGITDASGVRLVKSGAVIDTVCYQYNASTLATLTGDASYGCEGTPVSNLPHNNSSGDVDASIERKPGGAAGNGTDTGDSTADFQALAPSNPQSTASAPTP